MLEKLDVKVWTEFSWIRIALDDGLLWTR